MAKRSRERRQEIPGYDESRPTREERKIQHRQVRHNTHQLLHTVEDPEEIALPEVKRTREHQTSQEPPEPKKRRFKVWKTKFWKRREEYQEMKQELDSQWPVITPNQIENGEI